MTAEILKQNWQSKWDKARTTWSPFVKLREPVWCLSSSEARKEGLTGSFAMIRLSDHRIVIDLEEVLKLDVGGCALQVLAHEIGHHIYTPANLHDNAILLSRIQWGLAGIENRTAFVANIYSDFLINDMLQRSKGLDMAVVYQKVNKGIEFSKLWTLLMRTYEYLWRLSRGMLTGSSHFQSPSIDADASLLASLIRSYSRNWLDGAGRFTALLFPYILEDEEYQKARLSMLIYLDAEAAGLNGSIIAGITEIDDEAVKGNVDPRREALGIRGEDKIPANGIGISERGGTGPQQRYLEPGVYIDLLRKINPVLDEQELLNNYYREIALPHLVDFPVEQINPVSYNLPEGTGNWDFGDSPDEIDWLESAVQSPEFIPGYSTVKRVYGPDNDSSSVSSPLNVYIGVDCSGSMGNPRFTFSWPVLAAAIIGLSALRAGAKVMACLSGEPGSFLESEGYSTSEKEVLTVLTSYLGTGYAYGIPRLKTPFGFPVKDKSHVIVVTDDDIFSMLSAETKTGESNWDIIEQSLKNAGGHGTLVLHSRPDWHRNEVKRLVQMGWEIYYVTNEKELLDFARSFSAANYHSKQIKNQGHG
ncbi:DUF58 domain-containing protein [Pararcticibacter amylolyticus]|uniref:VWA domain-containing protein n=1 Tax=Pararcticibacter amylolyticus TaxID=2173175 RepID=A0A2U2PGA6_9SPHI|nr:hypothetical protein [Pararcticibacter amylolyticus]PWG80292.1 hypothetical protein DDR33_11795 [Pararcticibacter amylolyticus]